MISCYLTDALYSIAYFFLPLKPPPYPPSSHTDFSSAASSCAPSSGYDGLVVNTSIRRHLLSAAPIAKLQEDPVSLFFARRTSTKCRDIACIVWQRCRSRRQRSGGVLRDGESTRQVLHPWSGVWYSLTSFRMRIPFQCAFYVHLLLASWIKEIQSWDILRMPF